MKYLFLIAVLAPVSCKTSSGSNSNTLSSAADWRPVLACYSKPSGGLETVRVDIDFSEQGHGKHNVQVVVTDKSSFDHLDKNISWGQVKIPGKSERIYQGRAPGRGVAIPRDFAQVFSYDVNSGADGTRPGWEARFYDKNTLVLRNLDLNKQDCAGALHGLDRDGLINYAPCETANYVFKDCRLR